MVFLSERYKGRIDVLFWNLGPKPFRIINDTHNTAEKTTAALGGYN